MPTIISFILSTLALGFSLYVFSEARKRDRRDMFLKVHNLLLSDDALTGRQILYEKITDEVSVERLTNEEYSEVHRAVGILNALAYYLKNGYVDETDVMAMWGEAIYRACLAAKPVMDHREHRTGYRPWKHLDYLWQKAEAYVTRIGDGTIPNFTVWRRQVDSGTSTVEK